MDRNVTTDHGRAARLRTDSAHEPTDEEFSQIRSSLRGLRFGSVNIIVQDGVIVQIDRTERRRLRTRRE